VVPTSFACGAVPDNATALATAPDLSQCNYAGYNLAPLAGTDLAAYVIDNSYGGPYNVSLSLHSGSAVSAVQCSC
jgi:hypothetical protein